MPRAGLAAGVNRGGDVIVSVALPPKKRWRLVLRNGGGFARQYRVAKQIAAGELKYRELSIVERKDKASGKRVPMVKIVYDAPQVEATGERSMVVRTKPDSLLVASEPDNPDSKTVVVSRGRYTSPRCRMGQTPPAISGRLQARGPEASRRN